MRKKMKSMQDIYRQAGNIARELYGSKMHPKGWMKVKGIEEVYLTNIAQHFGFAGFQEFHSNSCASVHDINEKMKADDIYTTAVGREVYAHPFDWDRIRKASSMRELVSLGWTLHWMGYDLDFDSWTFEEMKADMVRIADEVQGMMF